MANLPMNFAENLFKEYDAVKNKNQYYKNILHEIWDILDDPKLNDGDANLKISELDIFDEIIEDKNVIEDKKKENAIIFEDADETDYKILNKEKFNHEIKEALKKKPIYDTPSEEESEEESDEESDEECKAIKKGVKKVLSTNINSTEEYKKILKEEKKEENKAKKNNETMIREYLKEKNITKLHFLQEQDLIDYSKYYKYFKIKSTPKCYIVKYYNVKSDHRDTTLKSLRFKKP